MSEADALAAIRSLLPTDPQTAMDQLSHLIPQCQGITLAQAHQVRSRALRALGRHQDALDAIAMSVDLANQAGDPLFAARTQIAAVDSLGMLGRYSEASALAQTLSSELATAGAPIDAAKVLGNSASLFLRQDRYTEAVNAYDTAEALLPADADPFLRAYFASNRAIAQTYLGQDSAARASYQTAMEIFADSGLKFEESVVRSNIGFLDYTTGRYVAALSELTAAYQAFVTMNREHEAARCDLDTGDTYRALNLLGEARQCYERALAIYQKLPMAEDLGRAHFGLGAIAAQEQRETDALRHFDEAFQHFAATNNPVQQAHIQLCRAEFLARTGEETTALQEAASALTAFQASGLSGWAAEAELILARLQSTPDPQVLENVIVIARQNTRGWLECRAQQALGNYYRKQGDRNLAQQKLQNAVAALESIRTQIAPEDLHLTFLKDKESVYADLIASLLDGLPSAAEQEEALQVVERSRSRLLLEKLLSAQADQPYISRFQERLLEIRAALNRAYRDNLTLEADETRRPSHRRPARIPELEQEYRTLLQAFEREGEQNHETLPPIAVPAPTTLQSALTDEETLLLYTQIGDRLAVFCISRQGITLHKDLATVQEVAHIARRLRYHLQKHHSSPEIRSIIASKATDEIDDIFRKAYRLLIAPIASGISGGRLIIVPHGPIHGLPFAAFLEDTIYLQQRYEIQYAPSASIWYLLSQRPAVALTREAPALLVGIAGQGTQQTVAEVAAISRHIPAHVLLNEDATCDAVRQNAADTPLLHLATHALFRRDNPLFSGLQLADDWLLARDLYQWRLSADLVTLSACDTGAIRLESGEEWMGLARGFLAAGARRLVVSLWPADDRVTAELMGRFYRCLQGSVSPVTALREAQQTIREEWPHPYYWAPFCLIGPR